MLSPAAAELFAILTVADRSPRPGTMPENQEVFEAADDEVDEREDEVEAARSIS